MSETPTLDDETEDHLRAELAMQMLDEAKAEIERLRGALEQIAWETVDSEPPYLEMDRWQMSVVARRTLNTGSCWSQDCPKHPACKCDDICLDSGGGSAFSVH